MSNGDSPDDFVFPPFIPTASRQPAPTRPPAAQEPAPAAEAPGRMTMPWDLETPIVRDADTAQPAAAEDEDEDLPWLEVPATGDDEAPASSSPAAADDAFPEWMAWDQRDETAAQGDARDTVAPIAGLEEFISVDDLAGEPDASEGVPEWDELVASAEAAPNSDPFEALFDAPASESSLDAPAADADPFVEGSFDAPAADADPFTQTSLDATAAESAAPAFDAPAADSFADVPFDAPAESSAPSFDAPAAEPEPFAEGSFDASAEASVATEPARDEWSLATPEAAEPPPADVVVSWEDSPAAAEPSYEVSVDDADALTIEPAAEAPAAEEAAPAPQPFVADEEAVIAAEPDPFTAASVAEAEALAPAEPARASAFDDVASRLESIARMLRERPDELLAGGSPDPLALLVTGYMMGYTARGGR